MLTTNCGGCNLYGPNDCHCLCHDGVSIPGYHEIVYHGGEIKKSNFLERIFNKIVKNNQI